MLEVELGNNLPTSLTFFLFQNSLGVNSHVISV